MDSIALHNRLAELGPLVLTGADEACIAAVEEHIAAGCSRCARSLVNARDAAVVLAEAEASAPPHAELRERILASARSGALPVREGQTPRRFFDPAGEVARHHIGAPGDEERTREVDDLRASSPVEDDACARYLAQIERVTGFSLLFVSIVRGERVGYRAQRGFDLAIAVAGVRDRRRETTFCTHTVSIADAPLVIPNASAEPFFRGSNMVCRDGVKAYVGVPLRTSRGILIGTICGMSFEPRAIGREVVRLLELYGEPMIAEIERARLAPDERIARTAAGTPVHRAPWFLGLLDVELAFAQARSSSLVVATGADADALADVAEPSEPAGRIGEQGVGVLLAAASLAAAESRRAELQHAVRSRGAALDLRLVPSTGRTSAAEWIG